MVLNDPHLEVRIARNRADRLGALRLRHEVFIGEMGARAAQGGADAQLEQDAFDAHARHVVLVDKRRSVRRHEHVVGTYRLLDENAARAAGGFYSAREYELGPLLGSGRKLLEMGRSCLHRDYRNGLGLLMLWQGLAREVHRSGAEILFGVASFHGIDRQALAPLLARLHARHLAPPELRPVARGPQAWWPADLPKRDARADDCGTAFRAAPPTRDAIAATARLPALIRSYLNIGAMIGSGAWEDRDFNTTDICMVLDARRLSAGTSARMRAMLEPAR